MPPPSVFERRGVQDGANSVTFLNFFQMNQNLLRALRELKSACGVLTKNFLAGGKLDDRKGGMTV